MEIESSKDFQIAVEGQQHTLTINDPYPEDTGVFLISASNNFGKATSTGMWFIPWVFEGFFSWRIFKIPEEYILVDLKRLRRDFLIFVLCQVKYSMLQYVKYSYYTVYNTYESL